LIVYFFSNIFAKYYENPTMLSRVIAEKSGIFFETQRSNKLVLKICVETQINHTSNIKH